MGLRDVFQNAANTGFGVFADAVTTARYEHIASTTYDASSGVASSLRQSWMVSAIFERYSKALVDGDRIKPNDVKALILPDTFVHPPKAGGKIHAIEANSSVAYRIMDFEIDPMGALYIMQLRKSDG